MLIGIENNSEQAEAIYQRAKGSLPPELTNNLKQGLMRFLTDEGKAAIIAFTIPPEGKPSYVVLVCLDPKYTETPELAFLGLHEHYERMIQ